MRKRMWMGTRAREMWVPMPRIDPGYSRPGWSGSTALLNGGTVLRQSKAAHNLYEFEWNKGSWGDIMPIRDMADGVWDTHDGVNLIYFVEPTSMRRNVLPQGWATPALGAEDGKPLLRAYRPTAQLEAAHDFALPARSAVWAAAQADPNPRRVYVPIPPDHVAHFGWVGTGNGQVEVYDVGPDGTTGAVARPDALDGAGGVFTNLALARTSSRVGVEVGLRGTAAVTVRAMTLRILRTGESPSVGKPWAGGMGHSGCQFVEKTGLTPNSVPLDLIAATATLEETGAWL